MLKRPITFEDFNGETVTETHYFNLSKAELVEMEVTYKKGFEQHIQDMIATNDRKSLIQEFKEIILMAYGEKTDDGKRFVKNEDIRVAFSQTAAYQHLFIELATNDNAAADFIIGIVPKDLSADVKRDQDKPDLSVKKTTAEIALAQSQTVAQATEEVL